MKKVLLIVLAAALMAFLMSSVALAAGYRGPSYESGFNPHGNYSTTSNKCKVCHAVHNAASGGQILLRSTNTQACVYCHITNAISSKQPYGYTLSNYTDESDWNHDDNHNNYTAVTLYAGCTSCHSVHGANTISGFTQILKKNPGKALTSDASNLEQFCQDCHNAAGGNKAAGSCMETCHTTLLSPTYYNTDYNGVTHIMTTATTVTAGSGNYKGTYSGQIAWGTSETCKNCHKEGTGGGKANGYSFPHYTPSAVQFLDATYTVQDTALDTVCLNCHTADKTKPQGPSAGGVGYTF